MTNDGLEKAILAPLNPAQRQAVLHGEGPLLILAGAGSGKTRVIVHRIAHLIGVRGIKPWRILAVTFTNKAAGELRHRLMDLIGEPAREIWAYTFHAFCARLLRYETASAGLSPNFIIFDTDDQRHLIQQIIKQDGVAVEKLKPASVLSSISYMKTRGLTPDSDLFKQEIDPQRAALGNVFKRYQDTLRECNAVDFDDLLLLTVRVLEDQPEVLEKWRDRFDHVLIDEYQDTNQLQYLIAHYLVRERGNLCVVGDDDQSIYSWRGANVGNILHFEQDFENATLIRLEENYRSTANILDAAWKVVSRLPRRHPKKLRTDAGPGEKIRVIVTNDEEAEAAWIRDEVNSIRRELGSQASMAILYRANWQSRVIEEALAKAGILYKIVGTTRFYERREIRDIVAWLRLIANDRDEPSFRRCINAPRRGIGPTTLERLESHAREKSISFLAAAAYAGEIPGLPRRMGEKVQSFAELVKSFQARKEIKLADLIQDILQESGYAESLQAEKDGEDRLNNLMELISHAAAFEEEQILPKDGNEMPLPLLDAFLERVSLLSDVDEKPVMDGDDATGRTSASCHEPAVALMTLHSAKGLEFDAVIISGLEEGVFPHQMSLGSKDPAALDEERRLLYVGMTRARRRLALMVAETRRVAGVINYHPPARFLKDLPEELIEIRRADMQPVVLQSEFTSGRSKRTRVGSAAVEEWPQQGEMVHHEKWGTGQVVVVRGRDEGRVALVNFDEVGLKTIRLATETLEPM